MKILAGLLICLASGAPGIEVRDARAVAGWVERGASVSVDPETGALESAFGELAPARRGPAAARAAEFLAGLGLPGHALSVERILESGGATHVRFAHRVAGARVRGEEIQVHLGASGEVEGLSGAYHDGPVAERDPGHDAAEALRIALARVGTTALRAAPAAERVWIPGERGLVAAWEVTLASAAPLGDFVVVTGAGRGVLSVEDHLQHAHRAPELTSGTGRVFAHSPLDGAPIEAPLPWLLAASDGLSGAFARIVNADAPGAASAAHAFLYPPSDTHFDEVMVYYHLNRMHDRFAELGYHLRDDPITATVHEGENYDNAYFSPVTDQLAFGDGDRLNDLARDDSVIGHEYTHAAVVRVAKLYGYEAGAMNEGYADYFACSLADDPRSGVWVAAKLGKPWMRHLVNAKRFPRDMVGNEHKDGEIWGGACWDLRTAVGREKADRILYESWYYLGNIPRFRRGLEAALQADRKLFGGAHDGAIRAAFAGHGIELPPPRAVARQVRRTLLAH